jgi:hypothetical protein
VLKRGKPLSNNHLQEVEHVKQKAADSLITEERRKIHEKKESQMFFQVPEDFLTASPATR